MKRLEQSCVYAVLAKRVSNCNYFFIAMYVHRLGIYCILLRVFLYPYFDIALQLTKLLLKKVTTTTTTIFDFREKKCIWTTSYIAGTRYRRAHRVW